MRERSVSTHDFQIGAFFIPIVSGAFLMFCVAVGFIIPLSTRINAYKHVLRKYLYIVSFLLIFLLNFISVFVGNVYFLLLIVVFYGYLLTTIFLKNKEDIKRNTLPFLINFFIYVFCGSIVSLYLNYY